MLYHPDGIQSRPSQIEAEEYKQYNYSQLPFHTYHQDLQRNHKENGVQIIEDSQHSGLLIHP